MVFAFWIKTKKSQRVQPYTRVTLSRATNAAVTKTDLCSAQILPATASLCSTLRCAQEAPPSKHQGPGRSVSNHSLKQCTGVTLLQAEARRETLWSPGPGTGERTQAGAWRAALSCPWAKRRSPADPCWPVDHRKLTWRDLVPLLITDNGSAKPCVTAHFPCSFPENLPRPMTAAPGTAVGSQPGGTVGTAHRAVLPGCSRRASLVLTALTSRQPKGNRK